MNLNFLPSLIPPTILPHTLGQVSPLPSEKKTSNTLVGKEELLESLNSTDVGRQTQAVRKIGAYAQNHSSEEEVLELAIQIIPVVISLQSSSGNLSLRLSAENTLKNLHDRVAHLFPLKPYWGEPDFKNMHWGSFHVLAWIGRRAILNVFSQWDHLNPQEKIKAYLILDRYLYENRYGGIEGPQGISEILNEIAPILWSDLRGREFVVGQDACEQRLAPRAYYAEGTWRLIGEIHPEITARKFLEMAMNPKNCWCGFEQHLTEVFDDRVSWPTLGVVRTWVDLLFEGDDRIKKYAIAALTNFASESSDQKLVFFVGQRAVPRLIELARNPEFSKGGLDTAAINAFNRSPRFGSCGPVIENRGTVPMESYLVLLENPLPGYEDFGVKLLEHKPPEVLVSLCEQYRLKESPDGNLRKNFALTIDRWVGNISFVYDHLPSQRRQVAEVAAPLLFPLLTDELDEVRTPARSAFTKLDPTAANMLLDRSERETNAPLRHFWFNLLFQWQAFEVKYWERLNNRLKNMTQKEEIPFDQLSQLVQEMDQYKRAASEIEEYIQEQKSAFLVRPAQ